MGLKINEDGSRSWTNSNGQRHREDGPAFECSDGRKRWWYNGKLHRLDGPAWEEGGGEEYWLKDGLSHREDGPAGIYFDGSKTWWLKGKQYTEEKFNELIKKENKK